MLYTTFTLIIFGWMLLLVLRYGMAALPVMISLAAIAASVRLIQYASFMRTSLIRNSFKRTKAPVRLSTKIR